METKNPALEAVRSEITALYESRRQGTFSREELVRYVELTDLEHTLLHAFRDHAYS